MRNCCAVTFNSALCKIVSFSIKRMVLFLQDSQDASGPASVTGPASCPRSTGSMVAHHDDVVTRMKNIEMIELGRHRICPWYFSPYPQVSHENKCSWNVSHTWANNLLEIKSFVESEGFWQWCVTLRIAGLLDFVHPFDDGWWTKSLWK
jgi:hypothetical protein